MEFEKIVREKCQGRLQYFLWNTGERFVVEAVDGIVTENGKQVGWEEAWRRWGASFGK